MAPRCRPRVAPMLRAPTEFRMLRCPLDLFEMFAVLWSWLVAVMTSPPTCMLCTAAGGEEACPPLKPALRYAVALSAVASSAVALSAAESAICCAVAASAATTAIALAAAAAVAALAVRVALAASAAEAAEEAEESMWARMLHQIGAEYSKGWMEPRWCMMRSLWAEPGLAHTSTAATSNAETIELWSSSTTAAWMIAPSMSANTSKL
mmetsp:Transcript_22190/g.61353  ORF Transcript_22190/g.61353 Transcript_22190/m.61353 type:complete len:208 (-) Transcript_22190:1873-2496(-)